MPPAARSDRGRPPRASGEGKASSAGRYKVISELGEGAAAKVYACEDLHTGQTVALKALRAELAGNASGVGARDRFLREAAAMARMEHPNIVRVFAYGASNRRPWLAMELVDGPTLGRWVHEQNPAKALRPRRVSHVADTLPRAH